MTMLATTLMGSAAAGSAAAAAGTGISAGAMSLASAGTLLPGTLFTAGTGAIAGGSILSMLSNGLNLASAGLSLFGSDQAATSTMRQMEWAAREREIQSKDDEAAAKQEELRGKQEANDLTERMIRTISAQRLTSAANGLDISFGTPVSVEKTTQDIADSQMSTTRIDAQIRAISRRRQAQERLLDRSNIIMSGVENANAQRLAGYGGVLKTGAQYLDRRVSRG